MNSDILYDHYKETCVLSRDMQKTRNKFFVLLFVSIAVLIIITISPDTIPQLLVSWAKETASVDLTFEILLLQSLTWIISTYFLIRYIQATIYIEKQYKYIGALEKKLEKSIPGLCREGKNYLAHYPVVNDFIHVIYNRILLVILIICIFAKVFSEWYHTDSFNVYLIVDSILAASMFILIILYYVFQYQVAKSYAEKGKNQP